MKASKLFGIVVLSLAVGLAGSAVAEEDREFGSDEGRGYLGVALLTIENDGAGAHDNGVYIENVLGGSPAEAAGLKVQDRIVAIDGVAVSDFETLNDSMKTTHPDQTISVTLEREGAERTFSVTLDAMPMEHDSRWGVVLDENRPYFGIHIEELNPQLAEYFAVDGGLLVTEVIADAPADEAGLLAGDIVVAVEEQPIVDQASLHRAMKGIEPGDEVAVRIERRGTPLTLFVEVGSHDERSTTIHLRHLHELVEGDSGGNVEIVVPDGQHGVTIRHRDHDALHEHTEEDD